jgi:hypothetical protein
VWRAGNVASVAILVAFAVGSGRAIVAACLQGSDKDFYRLVKRSTPSIERLSEAKPEVAQATARQLSFL